MKMEKYLFHNFLEDKTAYQICKNYWKTKLDYFLNHNGLKSFEPYLNTCFANGEDFANGNPIINYYFAELNKTIRIIQEEPNDDDIQISAWLQNYEITNNKLVTELVISLQLTPATEITAYDLIYKWLISNLEVLKMERYIDLKIEISNLELIT